MDQLVITGLILESFLQDNENETGSCKSSPCEEIKELDDNHPTKNDRERIQKVIAGLVREGRYMIPCLPDGVLC